MFAHKSYLTLDSFEGTDFQSLTEKGYEIANCEFSFQQGIDQKGQPFTEVHGGTLSLILPMLPPKAIIEWSLKSNQYKKGVIVVLDHENVPLNKIFFENAACINMCVTYTQKSKSYATTTLVIQAEELRFGRNVDFSNEWVQH